MEKYYIIIPGHIFEEIIKINNVFIQNYSIGNCTVCTQQEVKEIGIISKGLKLNTNNNFQLFSFFIYNSNDKISEALSYLNKIMTVFFYSIIIEKQKNNEMLYDNELLTYYICKDIDKRVDESNNIFYVYPCWINGMRQKYISYFSYERVQNSNSDYNIYYNIDKRYINHFNKINISKIPINEFQALERYISALQNENIGDQISAYLCLSSAFENLINLKGTKYKHFGNTIKRILKIDIAEKWAKDYYSLRGIIIHANKIFHWPKYYFKRQPSISGYKTLYWRHPEGSTYTLSHIYLASRVFPLVFDNIMFGQLPHLNSVKSLFSLNEVIYHKIKKKIDKNIPFGRDYYEDISSLKKNEWTGERNDLEIIIEFLIKHLTKKRLGISKLRSKLIKEQPFSRKYRLIIYQLSQEVEKKRILRYNNVLNKDSFELFKIIQLLEIIHYTLSTNY